MCVRVPDCRRGVPVGGSDAGGPSRLPPHGFSERLTKLTHASLALTVRLSKSPYAHICAGTGLTPAHMLDWAAGLG